MSVCQIHLPGAISRWEIPNHWSWVSIADVGEVTTGNTPPTKEADNYGPGIPFVKPPELNDRVVRSAADSLTLKGVRSSRLLPKGAVLISCIGGLGKTGLATTPVAFNQQINAIVFDKRVIPKFGFYYAQTLKLWLYSIASATTLPIVNKSKFKIAPFPLAPIDEQQAIVAEIEKQFSRLDEAVASLKRTKANLKRYKAAVLKAAVEGKLTEDWRKQHPDVEPASKLLERILAERREKYGGKKDGFLAAEGDAPAEPPDGWTICSIDQIAECLDSKRVPVNKAERTKRSGNVPYYGANGQVGVIDDYIFDEPLVLVVEDETFTGRTQSFSYMIRGRSWVNNHAHVLRATSAITTSYLNYGLAHYPFIPKTTGSTGRRKLTQRGLMTAPLLLPPLAEQEQIVSEVERRLSVINELEATIDANLTRADRLRQSILQRAFSGSLF